MKQIISNQPFKLFNAHLYTAVLKQMPKMARNEQVVEFHSPWAEHQTLSICSVSWGDSDPTKYDCSNMSHLLPPIKIGQTGPKISHMPNLEQLDHQGTLTQAPSTRLDNKATFPTSLSAICRTELESHSMEMVEFSSCGTNESMGW